MGTTDLEPTEGHDQPDRAACPAWAPPADRHRRTARWRPPTAGARRPGRPPSRPSGPPLPPPADGRAGAAGHEPPPGRRCSARWPAGLVAALVATGVTVALDDDTPASVDRPVVTPVTTSEGTRSTSRRSSPRCSRRSWPSRRAAPPRRAPSRAPGSGIVLSADGLVLTNAHVIGSVGDITVVLSDGSEHPATLVGASPDDDLAVIQVQDVDEDLVPAELGSSDDLQVGDEVIAIGNALNLGGEPTVTRGIVSAKDRDLNAEGVTLEGLIQTDAAINPGNSGGPLVNAAGQVVGMNTAIVADAQNLGFSIAIDVARPIIEDLKAGEGQVTPDQAFLGVSSTDVARAHRRRAGQLRHRGGRGCVRHRGRPRLGRRRGRARGRRRHHRHRRRRGHRVEPGAGADPRQGARRHRRDHDRPRRRGADRRGHLGQRGDRS